MDYLEKRKARRAAYWRRKLAMERLIYLMRKSAEKYYLAVYEKPVFAPEVLKECAMLAQDDDEFDLPVVKK
jgi:hypothetical protein